MPEREGTYMDYLSGQCRELAERFRLSGEQTETLRKFVTDTSMRSWRNGNDYGFKRARNSGESPANE